MKKILLLFYTALFLAACGGSSGGGGGGGSGSESDKIKTLMKSFPSNSFGNYDGDILEDEAPDDVIVLYRWYSSAGTTQAMLDQYASELAADGFQYIDGKKIFGFHNKDYPDFPEYYPYEFSNSNTKAYLKKIDDMYYGWFYDAEELEEEDGFEVTWGAFPVKRLGACPDSAEVLANFKPPIFGQAEGTPRYWNPQVNQRPDVGILSASYPHAFFNNIYEYINMLATNGFYKDTSSQFPIPGYLVEGSIFKLFGDGLYKMQKNGVWYAWTYQMVDRGGYSMSWACVPVDTTPMD